MFGSVVNGVRALPPGDEAQVAAPMALAACVRLAGVPWERLRGAEPILRLHRPDLPRRPERPWQGDAG